ncbi:MAG: hypothetical protein ACE5D8_07320, partial [Fidelibacterota bacterium]
MSQNSRKPYLPVAWTMLITFIVVSCDFQSPANFEMPTWFMDLKIPITSASYPLSDMANSDFISTTPDSQGFQIMFEGDLPDTSIDPSYLQVPINQDIQPSQPAVPGVSVDFVLDTTINIVIPMAPLGFVDIDTLTQFQVPAATNHRILASTWNTIAANFDTLIQLDINIPQIDPALLPDFITSVDKFIIVEDGNGNTSLYQTDLLNNGLPSDVENIQFRLMTDTAVPMDTLANHTRTTLPKDSLFSQSTSLSRDSLGTGLRMQFGFDLQQITTADTITINAGDSVQVNIAIRIRIGGIDGAVVTTARTDIAPEMPSVDFPSDIELYSGAFSSNTGFGINEISVSNLKSTFPFAIDFYLHFRNFLPPAGSDSVKIDTTLSNSIPAISKDWKLDGYVFANPDSPDSALTTLNIDMRVVLQEQQTVIPLDGSDMGSFDIRIQVTEFHFDSLQAKLIQSFPPSSQEMTGLPQGFTGMAFTDVRIEFEMLNQIQLPVNLDIAIVGISELGDTSRVTVVGNVGSPTVSTDTVKTIIRLWKQGTTSLIYASPSDTTWTDSITVPPGPGETTIVDLLSSNPASINVDAAATIDGRGNIVVGASIGGSYRLIAPFEVRMDPMTFIPQTQTPLAEMSHENRNMIRNSLIRADLNTNVINHVPVGGEIAILQSNQFYFPLDTTAQSLSAFRDTMVATQGWSPTDSLYIIRTCDSLDPSLGNVYIFNILDDYTGCVDGLVYLVKSSGSAVDTVISYVDTLAKIILPDPLEIYADTATTGHPGAVAQPGTISYSSVVDTNRIRLMTDPGSHYIVPRFQLNGTNGQSVFLSFDDYISISANIVFRVSNTGVFEAPPDELVIQYPNGGETLFMNRDYVIKWKTYGTVNQVNLYYGAGASISPSVAADWSVIATEIANVDSFLWTPVTTAGILELNPTQRDSIRVRIEIPNSTTYD